MGIFIHIRLEADAFGLALGRSVVSACPVDIFEVRDGRLAARSEMEDECTLCELCLDLAPAGALTIHKLYKDERLASRGDSATAAPVQSPRGP